MIMIIRMVNVVGEQGTFWVTNTFIWSWLLLPILQLGELIKRDCGESQTAISEKTIGYFAVTFLIVCAWFITIPLWTPFIQYVMNIENYSQVFFIALISIGFYVLFAFNNVIDSIFYGIGKTNYMLFQSVVINAVFYGTAFVLYATGVYVPTLISIALMFAIGTALDSILTFAMFWWLLKKESKLMGNVRDKKDGYNYIKIGLIISAIIVVYFIFLIWLAHPNFLIEIQTVLTTHLYGIYLGVLALLLSIALLPIQFGSDCVYGLKITQIRLLRKNGCLSFRFYLIFFCIVSLFGIIFHAIGMAILSILAISLLTLLVLYVIIVELPLMTNRIDACKKIMLKSFKEGVLNASRNEIYNEFVLQEAYDDGLIKFLANFPKIERKKIYERTCEIINQKMVGLNHFDLTNEGLQNLNKFIKIQSDALLAAKDIINIYKNEKSEKENINGIEEFVSGHRHLTYSLNILRNLQNKNHNVDKVINVLVEEIVKLFNFSYKNDPDIFLYCLHVINGMIIDDKRNRCLFFIDKINQYLSNVLISNDIIYIIHFILFTYIKELNENDGFHKTVMEWMQNDHKKYGSYCDILCSWIYKYNRYFKGKQHSLPCIQWQDLYSFDGAFYDGFGSSTTDISVNSSIMWDLFHALYSNRVIYCDMQNIVENLARRKGFDEFTVYMLSDLFNCNGDLNIKIFESYKRFYNINSKHRIEFDKNLQADLHRMLSRIKIDMQVEKYDKLPYDASLDELNENCKKLFGEYIGAHAGSIDGKCQMKKHEFILDREFINNNADLSKFIVDQCMKNITDIKMNYATKKPFNEIAINGAICKGRKKYCSDTIKLYDCKDKLKVHDKKNYIWKECIFNPSDLKFEYNINLNIDNDDFIEKYSHELMAINGNYYCDGMCISKEGVYDYLKKTKFKLIVIFKFLVSKDEVVIFE